MKIAMQELIKIINNKRKESDISNTLLRFCQVEAEKLIEKEKDLIIKCYREGIYNNNFDDEYHYYQETFGDSNQDEEFTGADYDGI